MSSAVEAPERQGQQMLTDIPDSYEFGLYQP